MKGLASLCKRRMTAIVTSSERRANTSGDKGQCKCHKPKRHTRQPSCQCSGYHSVDAESRVKFFNIPELLSIVFEHSLPEIELPSDDPLAPPRLFTRVCRLWRQVALTTPRLWARLDLVCFPSIPCKMVADRHFNLLSNWLSRSGNCPTSLRLRYIGSSASDVRNISQILAAALPYSHRWKDIDITAPMPCLRPILHLLGSGTPMLEMCRVTITSASAPSEREDLVVDLDNLIAFRLSAISLDLGNSSRLKSLILRTDALTDAICISLPPSLQTLNFNNFDLLLGPPGLNLSIRQNSLKKLSLHSRIQGSLLRQLAEAFPFLEDVYLNIKHGMDSDFSSGLGQSSITFPKMRSISLRAISMNGTADLHALGTCLDVLELPALTRLSLSISCARVRTWTALSRHLARTRPPLTDLTFMGAYFSEDEFLAIVKEVPKLERLKMCARLSDRAFDAFSLLGGQSGTEAYSQEQLRGLCPRLKYLDIPLANRCSSDAIISMLLSRCSQGYSNEGASTVEQMHASLEECRLILSEPSAIESVEQHPDVIHCVENGLVLDLRTF